MEIPQQSVWRGTPKREYPKLEHSLETDVLIIGGGLTGIIAAYLLRASGKKVVVVEQETLGNAATGLTTAFLIETLDTEPSQLLDLFGKEKAIKALASHRSAISWFEKTIQQEQIKSAFMRCPLFVYAKDEKDREQLREEAELMEQLGIEATFHTDKNVPLLQKGYVEIKRQAKFDPLRFLYALAEIVYREEIEIYEKTPVITLNEGSAACKEGVIRADYILVATHYPAINKEQPRSLFFKKAKYITYVFEVHLPKGTLPEALFEDTGNPYHYLRVDALEAYDRLIIGGEDHRADIPIDQEKSFEALEAHLKKILPDVQYNIVRKWKGPIIEPGDGLAYIGPLKSNSKIVYATGYSGSGMTYAVIAAHIFADMVLGKKNEYTDIYTPHRALMPHVRKAKDYLVEFLRGAVKNMLR